MTIHSLSASFVVNHTSLADVMGWSPDPVTLCILYLRGIAVYRSAITLMIDSIRHFSTAIKVVDECWEHWKSTAESLCKATTRVLVKTILC